ncbi:MAG: methylmalonyl-CoA mutase family protein [Candidatus Polarisedimenticolia bacterium]|nr:methylmalonyl-CoA mutase family protein [bacterium]
MSDRDQIARDLKQWEEKVVQPSLTKAAERREKFETTSKVEIKRVYTPLDTEKLDYTNEIGLPGQFPFTRGVQPTMYRSRFWTMRQYAGFGTAEESNARYKLLLGRGQTGLSVAFDLPTQMGYDSDHALAEGEVGKVGVAIDSLADMEVLFNEIPLGTVSTSMTINAPAAILLAMYVAVAKKQGVEPAGLAGTIQNDVLKEYIARGTYIFPPRPSIRVITDIFAWCHANVPKWNTISISGYHIREAGSTAAQEVAFTLADGIAYVQAALDAGMPLDGFASRLSFFLNGQINILEEVAKFRAARRMWAKILRDRFGAEGKNLKLGKLRFHCQTAGVSLTAQQPENNIVRTAYEALAAVLGGCQSLHTNSMDEALGLPTEKAVTIALRTQQLLAYETGVGDTVDPLAGSYYVEALTDEIEAAATALIKRIDEEGGAVAAIEKGFQQREIADAAYRYQKAVESGEQVVVGVNKFTEKETSKFPIMKISEELRRKQCERTAKVRAERDQARWQKAMARVEACARGTENLMPAILEAVEAYATVGEIAGKMAEVFGRYGDELAARG